MMEGWQTKRIKDFFDVEVGGDLKERYFSKKATNEKKFPIFSNSLQEKGLYGFTSKPNYPANSITITGRGDLGYAEYREVEFDAIVRLLVLIPTTEIDTLFMKYYINGQVRFPVESTGVPQLTAPKVRKAKIQIPKSKPEQTAIAGILSKVDEAINTTQKSIKAAEKLKKALMQNLLTGKLKPDGTWRTEDEFYTDEKMGKVPVGWTVEKLKDVLDVNKNTLSSKTDSNYTFRYITIEAVSTNKIEFEECPEYKFKNSPGRARRIIEGNDILISGVRPNLKSFAIYNKPDQQNWICSTGFYVLTAKANQNSIFYFNQILSSIGEAQFHSYVAGSNYPAIGDRDLKNMLLYSPKENEQKEIANKFESIENKIEQQQDKIKKLQRLKKSLMQNLLTGKKRVEVEKLNKLLNAM